MMAAHRKEIEDTLRLFARYVNMTNDFFFFFDRKNMTNDYTRFLDYYRFFKFLFFHNIIRR